MTRLSTLLLAAGGLAVVVALEVSNAPHGDVAPLREQVAPAASFASRPIANHTGDWVATVLARPLFSPDRRPANVATTVVGGSLVGLPRLAGIMVGPFGRSAIFATGDAKPMVVEEGAHIASYTVKSIESMQVRLLGPNGEQVLYPTFATAAAPGRPVRPAPPPR
jgi:hypothetical protein